MTEEEFTKAVHAIEPRPDGTGWSMLVQFAELCARRAAEEKRAVMPKKGAPGNAE